MGNGTESSSALCRSFYNASQGPSWEVVLGKAGHFQFLDSQSMLQRTICAVGPIQDVSVRGVAQVSKPLNGLLRHMAGVGEGQKYSRRPAYAAMLRNAFSRWLAFYHHAGQELTQM